MVLLSVFLFALPTHAYAPIRPPEPPLTDKEDYIAYATKQALAAKVLPSTVVAVIQCESNFVPDAIGDHGHSHGLVQIYDTAHPDISLEQANDPKFAINYLIQELKEGNGGIWTCWSILKNK